MSEIKLNRRYPDSKPEDIIDAYTRGFEIGLAAMADENAKLRELCFDLWASCPVHDEDCQVCKHYDGALCDLYARMEELEVES